MMMLGLGFIVLGTAMIITGYYFNEPLLFGLGGINAVFGSIGVIMKLGKSFNARKV